ncbi:DMT family transporter [Micromonospora aurantiaca (nom. illeg.)]|uniref:hypothetical protein n=1 Tax=Micromonospora aurantiaca (nom. illeg.) TaxID=47850 RepID=UPI00340FFE64
MNLCRYAAIDRLPLGATVTLDFLGPFTVALLAAHRIRKALCALVALAGVTLIAGPSGYFDLVGKVATSDGPQSSGLGSWSGPAVAVA